MNINPRFPGGIPLLSICYKYKSRKVLAFIANEGAGITKPGDPYLYFFPENNSNVSVCPVIHPHLLGRYFNACYAIENHNKMWQYDLVLEKKWVRHSGYFRLSNTVALGMGITDGSLLYCHGVSEENVERKISTLECNKRTVCD